MIHMEYNTLKAYHLPADDTHEKNQSKKGCKDQESIQSSTTADPGYHMEKWQKHN